MTQTAAAAATAEGRRDACLSELDGFYQRIEEAAECGDLEALAELVAQRGAALDRFLEAHATAPLEGARREALLDREARCQRRVAEAAEAVRADLMQQRRRGVAARHYAKGR